MIQDSRHALFVGCVLGLAARRQVYLRPVVDEDGNWTAELKLSVPDIAGVELTVIVPPPPDDWDPEKLFVR